MVFYHSKISSHFPNFNAGNAKKVGRGLKCSIWGANDQWEVSFYLDTILQLECKGKHSELFFRNLTHKAAANELFSVSLKKISD